MNSEKNPDNKLFFIGDFIESTRTLTSKWQEKVRIFMSNHRKISRHKLVTDPINLATFLSVLPFVLGFSEFFNQKYPLPKKKIFFAKNIPGISVPTQKLNWDTFEYILSEDQKLDLVNFKTNTAYWSDKDLLIEVKGKTPAISSENLRSYIPQGSPISDATLKYRNYKFILDSSGSSRSYYTRDEIPTKLEGIITQQVPPLAFPIALNDSSTKPDSTIQRQKSHSWQLKEKTLTNKVLIGVESDWDPILMALGIDLTETDTQQSEFFKESNILKQEIRKLFTETGLNLIHDASSVMGSSKIHIEQAFESQFTEEDDLQNLEELMQEIDECTVFNSFDVGRRMSGYDYPDMAAKDVISINQHAPYSKFKYIQIHLPPAYLASQILDLQHPTPPDFRVNSKRIALKDQADTSYQGPAVLLNSSNGMDFEIKFKETKPVVEEDLDETDIEVEEVPEAENIRGWLADYLAQNPFLERIFSFFGVFEFPGSRKHDAGALKSEQNYWIDNLSLFRTGTISNTTPSTLPFKRSFQVPYISPDEWQQINDAALVAGAVKYNSIRLPIMEVRLPQSGSPVLNFGCKTFADSEFKHPFSGEEFDLLVRMNYIPNSTSFSEDTNGRRHFSSGFYKKFPSIFEKSEFPFFTDLWEPLTLKSWLVTAQLGFAFLVFRTLRALINNYGNELLVYLLDLVAFLGFLDDNLKQEIEILMGKREKGFRIIDKTTQNFSNIAGVEDLLPDFIEIVWFLRNGGRRFSITKTLPRGILLTGPPGTGKTLLVQAIAGEAQVPVLALSGSSLIEPGESGALKLEILFQEARNLSPCIVFIDEVDTLAAKREQVLQNPMGEDEVIEAVSDKNTVSPETAMELTISSNRDDDHEDEKVTMQAIYAKQDMRREKLRILMQFLVEMDGIKGRQGILVIGATNRPEVLDAAVLRPGRFDRIYELGLPGTEKREEILKLYGQNLGLDTNISWRYLVRRTAGYSAADLAGIMNQSTLYAILNSSKHTLETIEYGIDRITTIGFENPSKVSPSDASILQIAYYQAGKILLSNLLEYHPTTVVMHLWPRQPNARALQINQNLQKYAFRFARRRELEHRIIGCYAGKAAEILFLQDAVFEDTFLEENLSDFGIEDMQFAQVLIRCMVKNWHFYGKSISIQQNLNILDNYNEMDYRDDPDKILFFQSFLNEIEESVLGTTDVFGDPNFVFAPKELDDSESDEEEEFQQENQTYGQLGGWQDEISSEFRYATRLFSDWFRLYIPDPQWVERNLEWTPPDLAYHGNRIGQKVSAFASWNDLVGMRIDYLTHCLILQSFNRALVLLDTNREILDKLAYELIHKEILREPEIEEILKDFTFSITDEMKSEITSNEAVDEYIMNKTSDIQRKKLKIPEDSTIIRSNWGPNSRRKQSRWFNLKDLEESEKIEESKKIEEGEKVEDSETIEDRKELENREELDDHET